MLLEAFENLRRGGRETPARPFGSGGRLHLGEDLADGRAGGGVSLSQAVGLVEQTSDPADPVPGPRGKFRVLDGGLQKVPADMGPAEGQAKAVPLPGGDSLVGAVAVDEKDPGPVCEVLPGNLGPPGGIQDVQRGVESQDDPGPLSGAGGIDDVVPGLVRLGEGGRPAPFHNRLVKGEKERGDLLEPAGDRAGGKRQAPALP